MTARLPRYLLRRVGLQVLGLLLVLTALMQLLELLDVTTEVLDRGLGIAGLARYALLRMPAEMVMALPLAMLLGAMSGFYVLARHHEFVAIRAAGVSLRRILLWLLPLPLLLGGAQFLLSDRVVPRAEAALKTWWDTTAPAEDTEPRWVQTRDGPASFEQASADGRRLTGLRLYRRGGDGLFAARVTAEEAWWQDGAWQLRGVAELRVSLDSLRRERVPARRWVVNLRPEDVVRLDLGRPHLSSMMLADILRGERVGAQPLRYYQIALYRSFTAPLAALVMLLLAMPTARVLARGGAGGGHLLAALALGLAYLLCDGIMVALGTGGRIVPALAVSAAPLAFALLGFVQLQVVDRS